MATRAVMADGKSPLTKLEQRFVDLIKEGHKPRRAFELAGYSGGAPAFAIVRRRPAVLNALLADVQMSAGYYYPSQIMEFAGTTMWDKSLPRRERIAAADLLRRCCADFAPPRQDEQAASSEITLAQLDSMIKQARDALANAKDITPGKTIELEAEPEQDVPDLFA